MHKISVVIVNYNSGEELTECVRSLLHSSVTSEIVVVDNASRDGSIALLKKEVHSLENYIKIIENKENSGFAAGCNKGISVSSGESILLLNPDCTVLPDTLENLYTALFAHTKTGMVGGVILNHDGTEQRGCRRAIPTPWTAFVNSFGLRRLSFLGKNVFNDFRKDGDVLPGEPLAVEAISGACMLVKREALASVGLLDEGYFLHCEDLDWCLQFQRKGWKILFIPDARLYHSKGSCSTSHPYWVETQKHKGMVRFFKKNYSDRSSILLFVFVLMGIGVRYTLTLCKIALSSKISGKENP